MVCIDNYILKNISSLRYVIFANFRTSNDYCLPEANYNRAREKIGLSFKYICKFMNFINFKYLKLGMSVYYYK